MFEGQTIPDIVNSLTGIGMLVLIAKTLFDRSKKQESEISKLRDEREQFLKDEVNYYKTEFKNSIDNLTKAINEKIK